MVTPIALLRGWLFLVVLERVMELIVSSRNVRRALSAGAVETGRGHHPAMVTFHVLFLIACAVEPVLLPRQWPLAVSFSALLVAVFAQALRWWVVVTLGARWSTRIVVMPSAPPVINGPYRFLRHPNYLAVTVELIAIPLVGGAVITAGVAFVGNALLLAIRIRAEERALGEGWARCFADRPRMFPWRWQ